MSHTGANPLVVPSDAEEVAPNLVEVLGLNRSEYSRAKEFKCHMCDTIVDRDWNGARNNALQVVADGGFGREPHELKEQTSERNKNKE